MSMLPKAIHGLNANPIKIPIHFSNSKKNPKIHLEEQKTLNIQSNLDQKKQC
jgi:hypothetical protein